MISVKYIREQLSLTQAELGNILGINQNTISQYELGKRDLTLKKLAEYKKKLIKHFGYAKINPLFVLREEPMVEDRVLHNKKAMYIMAPIRKELKLTQEDLANILGIHQITVSQYELGKRDLTLKKIAKYKQKLIEHFGAEKIETLFNGVSNQSIVDNNSSYKKNMESIVKKYNLTAEEQENLVILPVTELSRLDNIQVGDIILALKNPKLTIKGGIFIFLVDGKELMANLYRKNNLIVVKNNNTEAELKEEDINLIYEAKAIIKEL